MMVLYKPFPFFVHTKFSVLKKKHLLLIHGFLENTSMWQPLLDRVSKRDWNIQLIELPGHGNSKTIPTEHSPEAYIAAMKAQVIAGDDDQFFIVGHSMGGYLAAHWAMDWNEKVTGLLLFHSKADSDNEEKILARKRAIDAASENLELYVGTMIRGLFHNEQREKCQRQMEEQIAYAKSLSLECIKGAQTVMSKRTSAVDRLTKRHFPLYYFLGENDPSLPKESVDFELNHLKGAVAHWVEKTGHMGHFECPKEAGDFLQRILRADT